MQIKRLNLSYLQRGGVNTGALYIMAILFIITGIAFYASGPMPSRAVVPNGTEVVRNDPKRENPKENLQLYSFGGVTITPPAASLCKKGGANNHPEIIIAYSPMHARGVATNGQIKVWLNDNAPIKIAPAENVVRGSGSIKKPGDRTAKAPDGYLWHPAMYVFPNTVEANGTPYFPNLIRGSYNNGSPKVSYGADQLPPYAKAPLPHSLQLVWNVKDIGLTPGAYQLQFVIHDGAEGRGIGCISIRVYEPTDPKMALPIEI